MVHEASFLHPNLVIKVATTSLKEFRTMNSKEAGTQEQQESLGLATIPWQPPPESVVKINFDAAVRNRKGCIGLGIIARDCRGKVIKGRSISMQLDVDPAIAETLAAVQGILMGKELGANGIILEGDAKQVIQVVNSHAPYNSNYEHFVEDIQAEMMAFNNSNLSFISRDKNFVANG